MVDIDNTNLHPLPQHGRLSLLPLKLCAVCVCVSCLVLYYQSGEQCVCVCVSCLVLYYQAGEQCVCVCILSGSVLPGW